MIAKRGAALTKQAYAESLHSVRGTLWHLRKNGRLGSERGNRAVLWSIANST